MDDWEEEAWDSFPAQSTPTIVHAAHPVTTEVPPGYDGSTNWFRYADAVEEWCALTKVEAKRRGPAIAARLSGRAEIYKERLDRERLRDPETGVEYFLSTLRPFFVKDLQSVFLYRFFQLLRCNRGQTDHQRWMVKYEIARQKAVDAWLEATTARPLEAEAAVVAQLNRLREAARERLRLETRRDWPSPPPAGVPVQTPGSPLIHWYVAPGTPPWMPQVSVSQGQPPPPSPPPAAPMIAQQWMPPLWWPPVYPGPLPVAGGTFPSGGTTSSEGMMP